MLKGEFMFPNLKEIKEAEKEIAKGFRLFGKYPQPRNQFLRQFSNLLNKVSTLKKVPYSLFKDWVWVVSQARIAYNNENSDIKKIVFSSYFYLESLLNKDLKNKEFEKFFVWFTYDVVFKLRSFLGLQSRSYFLSKDEQSIILRKLNEYKETDKDQAINLIERNLESSKETFRGIKSESFLLGIFKDIDFIKQFINDDDDNGVTSRACLIYLIETDDAIPDDLGYAGIVDDLFVIESSLKELDQNETWGGLLEKFKIKYPFIDEIIYYEKESIGRKLPDFMKLVCGISLDDDLYKRKCFITPDCGSLALVISFLTSLKKFSKTQKDLKQKDIISNFKENTALSFKIDEKKIIKCLLESIDYDEKLVKLVFADNAKISTRFDCLEFAIPSKKQHSKLSKPKSFTEWYNGISPEINPLHFWINASAMNKLEIADTYILITRSKFEVEARKILPMNSRISDLVGINWISGDNNEFIFSKLNSSPNIIATHDEIILRNIMIENQNPKNLIIDGGVKTLKILDEIDNNIFNAPLNITILINESESTKSLLNKLKSKNFSIIPVSSNSIQIRQDDLNIKTTGPISSSLIRSNNQNKIQIFRHEIIFETLSDIKEILDNIKPNETNNPLGLIEQIESFLYELSCYPLGFPEEVKNSLNIKKESIIESLILRSGTWYNMLGETFKNINLEEDHPKKKLVLDLVKNQTETFFMLCPSQVIKNNHEENFSTYSNLLFITRSDIIKYTNISNLIITSARHFKWYDNLKISGAAENIYLFYYDFENQSDLKKDKYKSSQRKYLEIVSSKVLKNINENKKIDEEEDSIDEIITEDESIFNDDEFESLSSEYLNNIFESRNLNNNSEREILAQVNAIIFDDFKSFCLIPSDAKNICIKNISTKSVNEVNTDELEKNDFLIFPEKGNQDIVESLHREYIEDYDTVRNLSSLWKTALKNYYDNNGSNLEFLRKKLSEQNIDRHPVTINYWLNHPNTIAPRGWKVNNLIGAISLLTNDSDLIDNLENCLESINKIYKARKLASDEIINKLNNLVNENRINLITSGIIDVPMKWGVAKFKTMGVYKNMPIKSRVTHNFTYVIQPLENLNKN